MSARCHPCRATLCRPGRNWLWFPPNCSQPRRFRSPSNAARNAAATERAPEFKEKRLPLALQELTSKKLELEQAFKQFESERDEARKTAQTEASGNLLRLRNANAMTTMRATEVDALKTSLNLKGVEKLKLEAENAQYKLAMRKLSVRPAGYCLRCRLARAGPCPPHRRVCE